MRGASKFVPTGHVFLMRYGPVAVPLGTFPVTTFGSLRGCRCWSSVFGIDLVARLKSTERDLFATYNPTAWQLALSLKKHLHSKIEGTFFSIHILLSVFFFLTNESIPDSFLAFFLNGNVSSQPRRSSQAWHGPAYTGARVLCSSARRSGMVHLSTRVKERCPDGVETNQRQEEQTYEKRNRPHDP